MAKRRFKRTPTSTGNQKVFTWSSWVKRNGFKLPGYHVLLSITKWHLTDLNLTCQQVLLSTNDYKFRCLEMRVA